MNGVSRIGDAHCLVLDKGIYGLDAIKKTAYKFADKASIVLQPQDGDAISVNFTFKAKQGTANAEDVIADFCSELLDQDLREIVKRETLPIRNLILAHAFSRTSLVKDE